MSTAIFISTLRKIEEKQNADLSVFEAKDFSYLLEPKINEFVYEVTKDTQFNPLYFPIEHLKKQKKELLIEELNTINNRFLIRKVLFIILCNEQPSRDKICISFNDLILKIKNESVDPNIIYQVQRDYKDFC